MKSTPKSAPSKGVKAQRSKSAKAASTISWPVPIGTASSMSGVSARMVRHYESLNLLSSVARTDNGYRQYTRGDVNTLQFIKRGRDLGFAMTELAELVDLWHNRRRASASVQRIAQKHVDDLSTRMAAMQAMQRTLKSLLKNGARDDGPVLDDMLARAR